LTTKRDLRQKPPFMGLISPKNWILIFGSVLEWNIPGDYSGVSVALLDAFHTH
jgi:hypothetical protein